MGLGLGLGLDKPKGLIYFQNQFSMYFDGIDDCIITDGADTVAQPTTYSFWSKSSAGSQNQGVFGHGDVRVGAFHLNWLTDNVPMLYLGTNYYRFWNDIPQQDDGEWHHWVVYSDTNDITNCKLYCDGVLQTPLPNGTVNSGSLNAYTESLTIGSDQAAAGGNYFQGNIDEFAVFDRELTQEEITRMYNTYYTNNLIQNGGFDEIGNEEVENGDFSEVGSELITDGDFALTGTQAESTTGTYWSTGASWTIANNIATYGGVGEPYLNNLNAVNIQVGQTFIFTFTLNSDAKLRFVNEAGARFQGTWVVYTQGTHTVYITSGISATLIGIQADTNNGSFGVSNISVKEVGQDWTFGTGWTVSGGNGVLTSGSGILTQTLSGIIVGNTYKLSWETDLNFQVRLGGANIGYFSGNNSLTISSAAGGFLEFLPNGTQTGTIDNVSVKEVGQGWGTQIPSGQTVEFVNGQLHIDYDSSATQGSTGVYQSVLSLGKTYKTTIDVASVTGTFKVQVGNVVHTITTSGVKTFNNVASDAGFFIVRKTNNQSFEATINSVVVQQLNHKATNLMLNAGDYQSANPLITSTNSMEFDGGDEYLNAGVLPVIFRNAFSVSAWIWTDTSSGNHQIFSTGTGSFAQIYQIGTGLRIVATGGSGLALTTTNYFSTNYINKWTYLTIAWDGANVKLYRNGIEVNSVALTGTLDSITNEANIGRHVSNVEYWNGKITELGLYDRGLTSLEVASLYNQGMPTNLLVNRNDYQSGNPTVFNTKQVDFDGTDDYMQTSETQLTGTFTLSCWFKGNENDDFLFGDTNTNQKIGFIAGGIYLRILSAGDYTTTKPDGTEWNHIVVTRDSANKIDLYVNGGSANRLFSDAAQASTVNFDLFGKTPSGQNYNGQMSQVGMWNSTLTANEVSSLYNHGLPVDLNTNQAAYTSSSNLVGYWRMGSGTLDTYPLIADQTNATLGSELVINGDFLTNTTTGWNDWFNITNPSNTSQQDGYGILDATTGICDARQESAVIAGKTYKIEATIKEDAGANAKLYMSDGANYSYAFGSFSASPGRTTFVQYVVPTQTVIRLYAYNSGPAKAYYKNISIKQVGGNPAMMINLGGGADFSDGIQNGSPYANIVTDGDFPTGTTAWTAPSGWTLGNGVAAWNAAGTYTWISQEVGVVVGKQFKVTFDCVINSGNLRVLLANGGDTPSITESGSYEFILTPTGGGSSDTKIRVYQTIANSDFTITNLTATEVNTGLQGYWKMGSGINDEYPVIYDQTNPTLGAEEVTCGNFACANPNAAWTRIQSTISNGEATITSPDGSYAGIYQNFLTVGKVYSYNIDVTSVTNGLSIFSGSSLGRLITSSGNYQGNFVASNVRLEIKRNGSDIMSATISNVSVKEVQGNPATMISMPEGNITNQYPLTKIRNYYRMGDGIGDSKFSSYPATAAPFIFQDQTSPNIAHIPTTNTLHYSEDFSQYQISGTTLPVLTSGQLAPDGTLTATKVVGVIGDSSLYISGISSATACRSIYARTVTGTGTSKLMSYFGNTNNTFNLTEEWQRFELTGSSVTGGTNFYAIDFRGSQTLSELIIWGAQSEEQSQATAYLPSYGVASVRKATTTNLITYSEDFSQSSWVKDDLTVSSNSTTSPDGTLTADKIIGSTVSSRHNIVTSIQDNVTASISIYAKAKELRYLQIASANTVDQYANFDLLTGTVGTVGVNFSNVKIQSLPNEWYRITLVTINQYNGIYFSLVSGLTASWLESWVMPNNTDGLYIWGSQLEEQTQAETYAPTFGLPVTIDLFTENNYGTSQGGIIQKDVPRNL